MIHGKPCPLIAINGSAPMGFWQTTTAKFGEAPRPLRMACFVLAFLLAFALIEVIALLAFGRDAVVNFDEDVGLVVSTFIIPVLLAFLLVWFLHRLVTGSIER
jgi:hypothetical protein